jgi:hypothetical protein
MTDEEKTVNKSEIPPSLADVEADLIATLGEGPLESNGRAETR